MRKSKSDDLYSPVNMVIDNLNEPIKVTLPTAVLLYSIQRRFSPAFG